jgi:hypothetical protein
MSLVGQRTTTGAMDWDDFRSIVAKMERDGQYKFCLMITIGVFTGLRISDLHDLLTASGPCLSAYDLIITML